MRICGVSLSGTTATLALVESAPDSIVVVPTETKRVVLGDADTASAVQSFRDTFAAFMRDNTVDVVAIKKRATGGKFAGGAMTFKMEGLLQCLECAVHLIAPVTIASCTKQDGY